MMFWAYVPIVKCLGIVAVKNYQHNKGSHNTDYTPGLIILEPHISNVLNGHKTIELRKQNHKKHIGKRIALLEGGYIRGYADLVDVIHYPSKKALVKDQKKHRASDWMYDNDDFSYRYGYVLKNVKKLKNPKPYKHPQGAQIWVKLPKQRGSKSIRYETMPQIGDMTFEQYMEWRNPRDKFHEEAYETTLAEFNNPFLSYEIKLSLFKETGKYHNTSGRGSNPTVFAFKNKDNTFFVLEDVSTNWREPDYIVKLFIQNGTAFYDDPRVAKLIRGSYLSVFFNNRSNERADIKIDKVKPTKYLTQKLLQMIDVPSFWRENYPVVLQEFQQSGMNFQIRAKQNPTQHEGETLILVDENGYKVGAAQDEWGATLVMIVKEYRGHGLSKHLLKEWLKYNPNKQSGGFTIAGYHNAASMWRDRVLELQSKNHYESFPQKQKAKIILSKAHSLIRDDKPERKQLKKASEDVEILALGYSDDSLVLFDKRVLNQSIYDIDDKYIYGYVFFRYKDNEDYFIYQIDYNPKYKELVILSALQHAKNNGHKVFYTANENDRLQQQLLDVIELQGMENIKRQGDYIFLQKDLVPLKQVEHHTLLLAKEKGINVLDLKQNIVEAAYTKWIYYNQHGYNSKNWRL